MNSETETSNLVRPALGVISDPTEILRQMLAFRKATEREFSVHRFTKGLYKVSPALISLILKGERKITLDRVDELAKLMALTGAEKIYFRRLVSEKNNPKTAIAGDSTLPVRNLRKNVTAHILSDWLNVYVKDCFHIPAVQKNPAMLNHFLGHMASPTRIQKALAFLLREGHLRRTPEGSIVIETNLTVTENQEPVPSAKIRKFHRAALRVAEDALDMYPTTERFANTLLVCLSHDKFRELVLMAQEFAEKLKDFAEGESSDGDRLFQLIVNISPTGGRVV